MTRTLAILMLAFVTAGCGRSGGGVQIADAWIRSAPPGSPMAGYLTLQNGSSQTLRCESASSPDFGGVEIHRTVVENGMSRMLHDEIAEVAPGGSLRFEPGSYHLMLFRPQGLSNLGDSATITLHCDGQNVSARFIVRAE